MNEIKELLRIVSKHRMKKIDVLSTTHESENDYAKAAKSIQGGMINTDDEMAALISYKKSSLKFRTFKVRLKEKLLNSLLFLDFDPREIAGYGRAMSVCSRNQHGIRLLLYLSARNSAMHLAKITLKKAIEFEFAEIALFCAKTLRTQSSFIGDQKQFDMYNKLHDFYAMQVAAESKAAESLEKIYVNQVNFNVIDADDIKLIKSSLSTVKILMVNHKSYQVGLNYYRIKAISELISKSYHSSLKTWEEFDGFIEKYRHFEYKVRKGESSLQKMYCYVMLRDYKNGEKCAGQCEVLFKKSTNNWLIYKEYYFLLLMHTKKYLKAGQTINVVTNDGHFKNWDVNRREKWQIMEAYYNLMYRAGKIKKGATGIRQAKYRFTKFLNNAPILSKDKKGHNASLLIIQAVYLLLEHNYEGFENIMESLKRYASRYFPEGQNFRSLIFIKMIITVFKCGYDKKVIQIQTKRLYTQLSKLQFKHVSTTEGLEVVPFMDLWEIVLESLE